MNWHNITVRQFQDISKIDQTDDNVVDQIIAIVYGIDISSVEELSILDYNKKVNEIKFISTDKVPKTKARVFKNYIFIPDITKVPNSVARYIEVKHFAKNQIENLHLLCASMIRPYKSYIGFKVHQKYDAYKHLDYATDLLDLPIPMALSWLGFFLPVSELLKLDSRAYSPSMIWKLMWKYKMTKSQIKQVISSTNLDGFIK